MPATSIRVRVPFHDVDSTGRIHFTAMLRYMEMAEHELRRWLGFPQATSFPGIAFPRVHVSCDYRGAIRYDDVLEIEASVERVGHSSWTVAFTARLVDDARRRAQAEQKEPPVVAEGSMTMVTMDAATEQTLPIPAELRAALTGEENHER